METINKLLKKQAPKRRGKDPTFGLPPGTGTGSSTIVVGGGAENNTNATPRSLLLLEAEGEVAEKPNPVYVRWVSNRGGCRVGVPGEWVGGGGGVGRVFEGGGMAGGGGGGGGAVMVMEGGGGVRVEG